MKLIWIPLPRDVSGGQRDKKKPWSITSMYSILFNKRGWWNRCGYGAKFSEMINHDSCLLDHRGLKLDLILVLYD